MPFPIKYNLEERKQVFVRAVSLARHDAERRGEPYGGNIASYSSEQNVQLGQQDIEQGQKYAEEETEKLQRFMDDYIASKRMVVICRRFVFPQYNKIRFEDRSDTRQMSVAFLFDQLNLPNDSLKEVYEYTNKFTGRFERNGMQRLSEILDKELKFYRQLFSDPEYMLDPNIKNYELVAICVPDGKDT